MLEPLYQTIFETTGTATVMVEDDTTICRVNRGFEQLTGYSKGEVEGKKSWNELVEETYPDEMAAYHEARRAGGSDVTRSYELRIVTKDGDTRDVHATVAMIPGTKRSVASFLDITARKEMEKTVRESEEKFRLLFEKSADPALLLDGNVFVDCNEAALKLMRCSAKEQLIGCAMCDISPERQPDGRLSGEKAAEVIDATLEKGVSRFVWIHRDFSGRHVWTEVSLTVVPIRGRRMMYTLWRDITESKQAEARLGESEERYRVAIENSNDGVLIVSGERQVYANRRLLDIFGCDRPEEITEGPLLRWVHPDDRERIAGYARKRRKGEEAPVRYEFKGIRKDGATLHVEVSVAAIMYRGERVSLAYLRDVTENREAEEELRRSEEKYRKIFENAMEAIFQTSPGGELLSANPAFARILGYGSPKEVVEKVADVSRHLYADPRDRRKIVALLDRHDTLRNVEVELLHKQGHKIWVSIDLNTIRDPVGRLLHYEGTFVEITERKIAEDALKKREKELEAKSVSLEEANTALKVLLRRREEDKRAFEKRILTNIEEMVLPYIEKLKNSHIGENQSTYVSILESNLKDVVSPLIQKMNAAYAYFTPMEIQVANLARAGKTSKEISLLLGLSKRTIDTHKNNIRKKLDLSNKKINLQAYLRTMSSHAE